MKTNIKNSQYHILPILGHTTTPQFNISEIRKRLTANDNLHQIGFTIWSTVWIK